MTAPELTPAEQQIVDRFDAAPDLPELDDDRVEDLAYELWSLLSSGPRWYDLGEAGRQRWRDVARYALTAPGAGS